ncbi:MAG: methionyl-tRNA formyltransferase [Candidatus Paceibacterota bacterium]|jgi:methionyl-tRNA formyltransferase
MINNVNFVFFGTDEFSVRVLETLKGKGLTPKLIITIPDKPQGRKMVMTPPLVKVWGEKNGVAVMQLASLKGPEFSKSFFAELNATSENLTQSSPKSDLATRDTTSVRSWDFFLVASYGKIIPPEILDIPTKGTLNIHPSLLPKYRGPSPLETAILNGDTETGVTIIKLDAEMDHGPILASESLNLSSPRPELGTNAGQGIPLFNFEQLRDKTAELGTNLLIKILPDYLTDKIEEQEQDHNQATYTKKFVKEDGLLGQNDLPLTNYRKILALNPWPGTYLDYPGPAGKIRVIVKQAHLEGEQLIYDRVTPAGKKEMAWTDFLNGFKVGTKSN